MKISSRSSDYKLQEMFLLCDEYVKNEGKRVYSFCGVSFATINSPLQSMNAKDNASAEVHLICLYKRYRFNFSSVREAQKFDRLSVVYAEVPFKYLNKQCHNMNRVTVLLCLQCHNLNRVSYCVCKSVRPYVLAGRSEGRDHFEGCYTKRIKHLVYANVVWIHQAYDGDF